MDLSDVEQIVMDKFAIQKEHRYATVIAEPSAVVSNPSSGWPAVFAMMSTSSSRFGRPSPGFSDEPTNKSAPL